MTIDTAAGTRTWGVLGVPSSVAAHWPGIEQGPAALRKAGLLETLRAHGVRVADHGDLAVTRWTAERVDGRQTRGGRSLMWLPPRKRIRPRCQAAQTSPRITLAVTGGQRCSSRAVRSPANPAPPEAVGQDQHSEEERQGWDRELERCRSSVLP